MHYFVKGYYEPPEDTEHDKRAYFPTNEQCERLFQKAWSPWCLKFSTIINEFVIIVTLFILNWACFRLLLSRPPFFVPKVDDVLHPQIILYLVDKVVGFLNPLNPMIQIWVLICCLYSFPTEVVGRSWEISSKLILSDHVHNSHDHSFLQSIDITRRNLTLITLRD